MPPMIPIAFFKIYFLSGLFKKLMLSKKHNTFAKHCKEKMSPAKMLSAIA